MSNEITTAFVQQYTTNVELLLQQRGSRFAEAVMTSTATGEAAVPVEQVGSVVAQKKTSRHADTPLIETPHARRWCKPIDYEWADLIDTQDKLRTLIDPQSPYAQNGAHALRRAQDDEVVAAFFASSVIGQTGTGTEAFAASQQVASGGVGLTVAKLRSAKLLHMAAEVDVDVDPTFVGIAAAQHDDLLSETQAINVDYTTRPVLVEGRIHSFMGYNFILSERLLTNGTPERRCPAWAKSGMHLCVWSDVTTDIGVRRDKSLSTQVYVANTIGATRLELEKVVEIPCAE